MQIVVLGGSGFLGSHVADELSTKGHDVTIYDKRPSAWLNDAQTMVVANILDEAALNESISGADYVYNFAGIADLDYAQDHPQETIEYNVLANARVLDVCRMHGVKRYVYASTVYVFSAHGGFYRCSKQAAESFIEEYRKTFGLNYTILRFGSLYGPRSDDTNGLYRIVRRSLEEKSVSYEGSEDAIREYIHVKDAAASSAKILEEEFENQHLILTGNEPMKVYDLLSILSEMLGYKGEIECRNEDVVGHYTTTPYSYLPKLGRKYAPPLHVDLGQGLLELIQTVEADIKTKEA